VADILFARDGRVLMTCSEMPPVTYVEAKQRIDLCTWNNTRFSTHEIAPEMNVSWTETVQEWLKDQPKTSSF
jgi:hypothetical protein